MPQPKIEVSKAVGTELLFENDRVRVWDMELQPGESSPHHRHESDYVYVYTTPSKIAVDIPGQKQTVREYAEGFVQFTVVGGGIEHRITNVADERHHQFILEFKGPSASADTLAPQNNGPFG